MLRKLLILAKFGISHKFQWLVRLHQEFFLYFFFVVIFLVILQYHIKRIVDIQAHSFFNCHSPIWRLVRTAIMNISTYYRSSATKTLTKIWIKMLSRHFKYWQRTINIVFNKQLLQNTCEIIKFIQIINDNVKQNKPLAEIFKRRNAYISQSELSILLSASDSWEYRNLRYR